MGEKLTPDPGLSSAQDVLDAPACVQEVADSVERTWLQCRVQLPAQDVPPPNVPIGHPPTGGGVVHDDPARPGDGAVHAANQTAAAGLADRRATLAGGDRVLATEVNGLPSAMSDGIQHLNDLFGRFQVQWMGRGGKELVWSPETMDRFFLQAQFTSQELSDEMLKLLETMNEAAQKINPDEVASRLENGAVTTSQGEAKAAERNRDLIPLLPTDRDDPDNPGRGPIKGGLAGVLDTLTRPGESFAPHIVDPNILEGGLRSLAALSAVGHSIPDHGVKSLSLLFVNPETESALQNYAASGRNRSDRDALAEALTKQFANENGIATSAAGDHTFDDRPRTLANTVVRQLIDPAINKGVEVHADGRQPDESREHWVGRVSHRWADAQKLGETALFYSGSAGDSAEFQGSGKAGDVVGIIIPDKSTLFGQQGLAEFDFNFPHDTAWHDEWSIVPTPTHSMTRSEHSSRWGDLVYEPPESSSQ